MPTAARVRAMWLPSSAAVACGSDGTIQAPSRAAASHTATNPGLLVSARCTATWYLRAAKDRHVWLVYRPDLAFLKSLEAALHPARVPYLYFVAHPDGHHEFRTTYAEHAKAVKAMHALRDAKARDAKARDAKERDAEARDAKVRDAAVRRAQPGPDSAASAPTPPPA